MTKPTSAGWLLVGVGTHLSATVVAGFVLGYATDRWLESSPVFMLLFGCLGFVGGTLKAYKILSRFGN